MTLTAAYAAHRATVPVPPYRIWARFNTMEEGVVSLWPDHLTPDRNRADVPPPDEIWCAANRERITVLQHAIAHRGGLFRAIYLAGNAKARPKQGRVKGAEPELTYYWRVTWLDPVTGAFTAEKTAERIQSRWRLRS
jgi:hypothetical protein